MTNIVVFTMPSENNQHLKKEILPFSLNHVNHTDNKLLCGLPAG
jgi:hypothetical protein